MSEQLYTTSRLRVWRECHRKHFYRYGLRIQTPSTPPMQFGTNAHTALEAYYRAWQAGDLDGRLAAAFAAIDEAVNDSPVDRIRLRALVAAYHLRWGDEPWDVLAVEIEFDYYLGDVHIGGKIDAIIRDQRDGRILLVEHKTSTADTSPGAPYWDRLAIDTQISIYIDGASMLGYEVAGCVYDVLKRPMHELLKATEPDKIEYTSGVGCKGCGGSAKGGIQGRGHTIVNFASEVKTPSCADCKGTGWKCDKEGQPQAPRPYAKTRLEDETLEQFEERVTDELAKRVDDYMSRGVIVRLDSELPLRRQELLDTVAAMRAVEQLTPSANHDACVRGRDYCAFFAACSGRADIHDEHTYPRGDAHPELAEVAATAA